MDWTVAIGVDTHKEMHVAVALDRVGRERGVLAVAASAEGYRELFVWASSLGRPCFSIEGASSYGAGLTRFLLERELGVFECERPSRRDRRRGKNDPLDALLAAQRLLAQNGLSRPRGGGQRETLRALLLERPRRRPGPHGLPEPAARADRHCPRAAAPPLARPAGKTAGDGRRSPAPARR
jgi:hypothetical protein